MAFKKQTSSSLVTGDPALLFKQLTKRTYPDVMPHQKDVLEKYAHDYVDEVDVALQLPTGSGKTLVGLLIADWRRRKNGERVIYLCPNNQLVQQTVIQAETKYGMEVADLSGPKSQFDPRDKAAYLTGQNVAISTYSSLFNVSPFFANPDIIIVDDAHAAENYISKMWSVKINANTPLHEALVSFLEKHIEPHEFARLSGNWSSISDTDWVEKLPTPKIRELSRDLIEIIDAHSAGSNDIYFPWSQIRDHLDACHFYMGSREILIRPLIPPTWTHAPFENAKQRIFMSATLGAGGDLERLTGRKNIARLSAPSGFQESGVGRRFFIFPDLSLTGEETDLLRLSLQKEAGRSVLITPSTSQLAAHQAVVEEKLPNFSIYDAEDLENNKEQFALEEEAVALLANRYDGIDFPNDECRLLCLDGLPKAMNAQERFLMSKMGASLLYNERIQSRVLQAIGRCSRSLQDRAAVLVTSNSLVDYLVDRRKWKFFNPELQAELEFGSDQSTNVESSEIFENFQMFLENNDDWQEVNGLISSNINLKNQVPFPGMAELENVVAAEINYQRAIWNSDYAIALSEARKVMGGLTSSELKGYRALWHYLAGAASYASMKTFNDQHAQNARASFIAAKKAAPNIPWLSSLSIYMEETQNELSDFSDSSTLKQIENLEIVFSSMGVVHNQKFEKRVAQILEGLANPSAFEEAQKLLGELMGFDAGNSEDDGAPDPWWLCGGYGIVFEDNVDANEETMFGAGKARQAAGHPKWIRENISGTENFELISILVTPCVSAGKGALPHLRDVKYWSASGFHTWAVSAIQILRELKSSYPGEADLDWRARAYGELEAANMTLKTISSGLLLASDKMVFSK